MENYRGRNTKGRMPLTAKQVGILFQTLVQQVNCPWAGALCLFQLFLGDRADAARQASTEWFRSLNPEMGILQVWPFQEMTPEIALLFRFLGKLHEVTAYRTEWKIYAADIDVAGSIDFVIQQAGLNPQPYLNP